MIGKPFRVHVQRRAKIQDVRVFRLHQVRSANLGAGIRIESNKGRKKKTAFKRQSMMEKMFK